MVDSFWQYEYAACIATKCCLLHLAQFITTLFLRAATANDLIHSLTTSQRHENNA